MPIFPQGMNQATLATQVLAAQASGRRGGMASARKRKRNGKKTVRARASSKRTRGGKKKARLVKGSAAAKRYMAKIRRKRRK